MTDNESKSKKAADMRRQADLAARNSADQFPQNPASLSGEEVAKILYELRIHQIELEMQNEELRQTHLELKTAHERYFNLFDLAPVGYVTLDEKGLILEANLTAARLLGKPRGALVPQALRHFIHGDDLWIFFLHRKKLLESGADQEFELRLVRNDRSIFWAHLTMTAAQDEEGAALCRMVISDISERIQAEEILKETNQRTIDILESITDAFLNVDENLVTNYFNTAAERLLKKNRLDVIGRNLFDSFPEAKGSIFEEKYTRAIREKKMLSFETYFGVKPYEDWYDVRIYPMQEGISVFFQIVTERVQAEDALRESKEQVLRSEARLKKAQSVARVGDWTWNIKDGQVEWSDEMYHIFGIDKNSYTGRLGDAITKVIHPDDLHIVLPSNAAAFTEKKPVEYRIIWPDGSIRHIWAESGEAILDEAGSPVFLTGIAQDITERKLVQKVLEKSEEQFRTLTSLVPVGIYLTDPDGTCVYANPAWLKMAGLSLEEALGAGWIEGIHPDDREKVFENWQKLVESRGKWNYEYRFRSREGKITHVMGLAVSQIDTSGEIFGYVGVNIDITERKQDEAKINEQLEELKRWYNITMGREGRILDLKREVNKLLLESGKPPRYSSVVGDDNE